MFLVHNKPQQAPLLAAAVVGACRLEGGWPTPLQPQLLEVLFEGLLGYKADFHTLAPAGAEAVVAALPSPQQRHELVELMVLMELLCRPIPAPLRESVERWAAVLGVDDNGLLLVRELAADAQARATADFYRLNWIGDGDPQDDPHFQELLAHYGTAAYALTVEANPAITARWQALANCPEGSLGQALHRFYRDRGFSLPGVVGAGNEALAHHDWIHVITGYDTTPLGEMQVTGFMAAASPCRGAMLGFLGAVCIWETGLLRSVVVTPSHHTSLADAGAAEQLAAAIARGSRCNVDPLVGIDYFSIADQPLQAIRHDWGLLDEGGDPRGPVDDERRVQNGELLGDSAPPP
jgi:hypothetical protein